MKKLNRNEWMAVGVAVVVVGYLLFAGSLQGLFGGAREINNQDNQNTVVNALPASGVAVEDLLAGEGQEAAAGDKVTVHYVGALPTGKVFDSSLDRNQAFTFTLGAGEVIRGWDEGLKGMKVGGIRRMFIAPDYGYGAQAIGAIPANSTLIFEVQLVAVEKAGQ